jgi:transcriptional regulator with XRE-family HTH domain
MSTYSHSLKAYLKGGVTQAELADKIGKTQVAVARYASGDRFPDAATAREIEIATSGAVPFAVWRAEFEQRSGLAA